MRRKTHCESSDYVVVMTACVNPAVCGTQILRTDPETRLQDYAEGLRFWLNLEDQRTSKIIFIDNSGYALDPLREIAKTSNPFEKTVEFISTKLTDYPEGVHYGYGELAMLDEVAASSQLFNASRYFVKCTGRLKFPKVTKLLDKTWDNTLFSVDCRRNTLFRTHAQTFVTTQLMIFSTAFYRTHLNGIKSRMPDEYNGIESLYYHELTRFEGEEGAVLRWPINVDPVGYAAHGIGAGATQAKNYNSAKQKTINFTRSATRVLLPSWWV